MTKYLFALLLIAGCTTHDPAGGVVQPAGGTAQPAGNAAPSEVSSGSPRDRQELLQTTAAIRDAFARGDVPAIVALHHPNIEKYFGGNNTVHGREDLRKGLPGMFKDSKVEFVENTIESTIFNGGTAIETSLFTIKSTPKSGGPAVYGRGRAMVVYVRYAGSPTGWASLREMAQAAPEK